MTQEERLLQEANDPSTTPERLAELVKDKTPGIAASVAQNPNTPEAILLGLAAAHPQAFIDNPFTALLLLERPGLLVELSLRAVWQKSLSLRAPQALLVISRGQPQ